MPGFQNIRRYKNSYGERSDFAFPSDMAAALLIQVVGVQAHTSQGNVHLQVTFYVKIPFYLPHLQPLTLQKEFENHGPRRECNMTQT